ncbi:hypothetical Protein YC6258_02459 [Gynuella sunshinyii YC6258]|uniref:Uncharacterized protein n=1 Tax=Gynuella sunshinyii YC6258 TaxID=1445510 RepID=A0A0C5VMC3_9GAMM|nr:hypothetical Protein YC6258_02459 [Gynuella sunshinyii YC6258]
MRGLLAGHYQHCFLNLIGVPIMAKGADGAAVGLVNLGNVQEGFDKPA